MQPATRLREFPCNGVDRFVIKARLGTGGMSEVFLAEDVLLKRQVAVKVIRSDHIDDVDFRHCLHREAERASQLNHENVARIYDLLEEEGRLLLIMEYVEGQTLRHRLKKTSRLRSSSASRSNFWLASTRRIATAFCIVI